MQANPNVFFRFVEGSQPNNLKELPNYRYITYAELNTYINQHGQET
jgi:hypothetical protein